MKILPGESSFLQAGAPSQALPRQLSRRESQGLRLVAKALGEMRKFPAVLLALPLGELSPQVTERAHAVSPIAKVLDAMRNLPGVTEGVHPPQHNICPNLSNPAPGKTVPPGQGNGDSVDCRQNQFHNIPELQQILLIFMLFHETASGSLAIFPIDKTVTSRI